MVVEDRCKRDSSQIPVARVGQLGHTILSARRIMVLRILHADGLAQNIASRADDCEYGKVTGCVSVVDSTSGHSASGKQASKFAYLHLGRRLAHRSSSRSAPDQTSSPNSARPAFELRYSFLVLVSEVSVTAQFAMSILADSSEPILSCRMRFINSVDCMCEPLHCEYFPETPLLFALLLRE